MNQTTPSTVAVRGPIKSRPKSTPVAEIPDFVRRARHAQPAWAALGAAERARLVGCAASEMQARAEEIGSLACAEMGKPLREAVGEARYCGEDLAKAAELVAKALAPERLEDESVVSELRFDALGVAVCITPWNFPVWMPQDVVVPSLVAGNTVILKPSEKTPASSQAWAECLMAQLPPDVLQVVHGDEAQGKALVQAEVNLVAFVGSRAAGKHIMREAGTGLKRLVLELGGKDALIVLEDADLDAAVTFATRNCYRNAGQVCVSTERIFVHERLAARFTEELARRAGALVQGDPSAEATQVGPMADSGQASHVRELIDDAIRSGAKVAVGGSGHGDFVQPTVLTGVTSAMRIMREETFGPVACIMIVASDDEAVRLANDSPYGLGGSVFGEREHAMRVARALETGMVGINRGCGGAEGAPWVGAKESGFGYLRGTGGHRQFAQVRVISAAR